jgi:hypothetical protein
MRWQVTPRRQSCAAVSRETARGARAGPRWAGALQAARRAGLGSGRLWGAGGPTTRPTHGRQCRDTPPNRDTPCSASSQIKRDTDSTAQVCVCVLCAALFTLYAAFYTIYLDTHTPPPASPDGGCTACGRAPGSLDYTPSTTLKGLGGLNCGPYFTLFRACVYHCAISELCKGLHHYYGV